MPRRPLRINHVYLARMGQALERVGVDMGEFPRSFVYMAWEDKLTFLRERYELSCCVRCKLPYQDAEMDAKYSLCLTCARTLHRKLNFDPKVARMMMNNDIMAPPKPTLVDNDLLQLLKRPQSEPVGLSDESHAMDILDRASRRRP